MHKKISVLTMDEKGQMYAQEAGFDLKSLPKTSKSKGVSDIGFIKHISPQNEPAEMQKGPEQNLIFHTVQELKNITKIFGGEARRQTAKKESPGKSLKSAVIPKILVKDNVFSPEIAEHFKSKKKKAFNFKLALFFTAASLILAAIVFFFILPKADVVIHPKVENLVRDMEISMGTEIQAADSNRLVMPATKVSGTEEIKNTFQSQGKKEVGNKAMGTVQIYNFTRSPLNLKANTTILQVGGKNYTLTADAMQIKPTGYKNSTTKEIDPKTLSAPVEVMAVEGGESSNLSAGTRLEITNQVFGSKPKLLYAKSDTPITGGTTRYLSVITDSDINNSQQQLIEKAVNNINDKLKNNNLLLIDKAYQTEIVQFTTDKSAGVESPNFQANLKIKITGLAFNPKELEKLAIDRISQTLPANKTLQANKEGQISYEVKSLDMNNGLAVLYLHFQGQSFYNLNFDNMNSELTGKTSQQANEILSSKDGIERIDIILAPSWQKHFPWLKSKIKIKIQTD